MRSNLVAQVPTALAVTFAVPDPGTGSQHFT
jgi:hypothetical protein